MPKVAKGSLRSDHGWKEYEIFYTAANEYFYVKVANLFDQAQAFFDSVENKKESDLEGLSHVHISCIGMFDAITADSKNKLESRVTAFYEAFMKKAQKEEKVILYKFEYDTETQNNRDRSFYGYGSHQKTGSFSMEFKYLIAIKKSFGDNHIYVNLEFKQNKITKRDVSDQFEIPWSQEMEDFIVAFSKSFDKMVDHMKEYFSKEGAILQLAGKNILPG